MNSPYLPRYSNWHKAHSFMLIFTLGRKTMKITHWYLKDTLLIYINRVMPPQQLTLCKAQIYHLLIFKVLSISLLMNSKTNTCLQNHALKLKKKRKTTHNLASLAALRMRITLRRTMIKGRHLSKEAASAIKYPKNWQRATEGLQTWLAWI